MLALKIHLGLFASPLHKGALQHAHKRPLIPCVVQGALHHREYDARFVYAGVALGAAMEGNHAYLVVHQAPSLLP